METSGLQVVSLSLLTGFLIHYAFSNISGFPTRKSRAVTNESVVPEEFSVQRNIDRHDKPTRVYIPNVFARWPWPRRINPNYAVVKKEADEWLMSFKAFSSKSQDAYNRCDFDLFACMSYPIASKEHVRAGCDLVHLLWTFDEHSDRSVPSQVRMQKDVIMDALRNPYKPRPEGEWIGGEIARQFWERTIQNASTVSQKRLIRALEEFLEEVVQESIDKKDNHILDVKSFIEARRRTGGVKIIFAVIELGLDIPDEVMEHPSIQDMVLAALDLITFYNDIFSYNPERLRGDDLHNIITCVMHEYQTDVNGAMLWIEDFMLEAKEKFHAAAADVPLWDEPLNSQIRVYCDGIGQCVRANDDWSFESERYFGNKGLEIKETRWMSLLPRKTTTDSEIGPVHIDGRLL